MSKDQITVARLSNSTAREFRAKRIRELMVDLAKNTLTLGKELKEAQDEFPLEQTRGGLARPGWKQWLKNDIGLSENHALTLIRIYSKLGARVQGLPASIKTLKLLCRDRTPESARQEIIGRIRKGERLSTKESRKIVTKHYPKPAEANRIARETGRPTAASDGNIYFGASKEKAKALEERRSVVFAVRRAVEVLATMKVTPTQFLEYALPHQLHKFDEHGRLKRAAGWMNALNAAWERRK
jgi:hypothetical protein